MTLFYGKPICTNLQVVQKEVQRLLEYTKEKCDERRADPPEGEIRWGKFVLVYSFVKLMQWEKLNSVMKSPLCHALLGPDLIYVAKVILRRTIMFFRPI